MLTFKRSVRGIFMSSTPINGQGITESYFQKLTRIKYNFIILNIITQTSNFFLTSIVKCALTKKFEIGQKTNGVDSTRI